MNLQSVQLVLVEIVQIEQIHGGPVDHKEVGLGPAGNEQGEDGASTVGVLVEEEEAELLFAREAEMAAGGGIVAAGLLKLYIKLLLN